MFDVSNKAKEKEIDDVLNARSVEELMNIPFEEWQKGELVQLMHLYYQYFNEHIQDDIVFDLSEYVVSGQYGKDRENRKIEIFTIVNEDEK